ncbi:MAG: hypothetical protein GY788_22120 [bacterium]|nr:hypothetical protein [bacterium]
MSFRIWDEYALRGGTVFDTADIYEIEGKPSYEVLAAWLRQSWPSGRTPTVVLKVKSRGSRPEIDFALRARRAASHFPARIQMVLSPHRDPSNVPLQIWADTLSGLEGSRLGVSNWSLERALALAEELERRDRRLDVLSNNFSIFVPRHPPYRGTVSNDAVEVSNVVQSGVRFHAWSPLGGGSRTLEGKCLAHAPWSPWRTRHNRLVASRLARIADALGVSSAAVALRLVTGRGAEAVTSFRTPWQLRETLEQLQHLRSFTFDYLLTP